MCSRTKYKDFSIHANLVISSATNTYICVGFDYYLSDCKQLFCKIILSEFSTRHMDPDNKFSNYTLIDNEHLLMQHVDFSVEW